MEQVGPAHQVMPEGGISYLGKHLQQSSSDSVSAKRMFWSHISTNPEPPSSNLLSSLLGDIRRVAVATWSSSQMVKYLKFTVFRLEFIFTCTTFAQRRKNEAKPRMPYSDPPTAQPTIYSRYCILKSKRPRGFDQRTYFHWDGYVTTENCVLHP